MRKTLIALLALTVAAAVVVLTNAESASPPGPEEAGEVPAAAAGEDVLAEMLAMSSERYQQPPAPARVGHVTPRTLEAARFERHADRFKVRLPSGAPVTTPAVYGGKVFVSGGFRSRQFYALDAKTGELAWGLDLDDDGPSTAACARRICVFNTESCTIFAVDAGSGKLLWSWWLGDPLMSAPTIAEGRVFTAYPVPVGHVQQQNAAAAPASDEGKPRPPEASHALAAFDLATGKVLWQRWIDSDVISAPVADGKELYAATFAGTVYRFDQESGKILAARRERATSAPTVSGDEVYFSKRTEEEGKAVEEGIASAKKVGAPARISGRKEAPYLDSKVQERSAMGAQGKSLDAANGFSAGAPPAAKATVAQANVGQASVSTLQAYQGSRVVKHGLWTYSTMGDEVVCASAADGKRVWSHKLAGDLAAAGGFLATPPVVLGDRLLVATVSGQVLLLDRRGGRELRQWQVGAPIRSQPVVDDGWIYVGTDDGQLVALDTGDRGLTGWPMWGGGADRNG